MVILHWLCNPMLLFYLKTLNILYPSFIQVKSKGITAVLLSLLFVVLGCNKSASDLGAEKIAGTYYGIMQVQSSGAPVPQYPNNYVIEIKPRSNGRIQLTCISSPSVFESFTTPITYANGVVNAGDQTYLIYYQSSINQLSLTTYSSFGNGTFIGTKR